MDDLYTRFCDVMEDLGFLEHLYEHLPENFTAVFEIARILEDSSHWLTKHLEPVLSLRAPVRQASARSGEPDPRMVIEDREELEAGLLRSFSDLPHMYHDQWLLPDEVLLRKLGRKELWVPYPREQHVAPIDGPDDEYNPDHRKQKVYILLDTSSSMAINNRIGLAKAVVYEFLRRNMREMGSISLRTFDTQIGELRTASSRESFHQLMSFVMRLHTLGNGTAMSKAIEQAIDDITTHHLLSGTELLIITDGACALNEERIRELISDTTVINTIKIGRSRLYASNSYVKDKLFREDTEQHAVVQSLQKRVADLQRERDACTSPQLRRRFEESLQFAQGELQRQVNAMTEEIVVGYGQELERLSTVYIQVDDIDLATLLDCNERRCGQIRQVYETLNEKMEFSLTLEDFRKLLLISDHVAFLVTAAVGTARRYFEALQQEITGRISSILAPDSERAHDPFLTDLSHEDRADIRFLLAQGTTKINISLWRMFLRSLVARLRRKRRTG